MSRKILVDAAYAEEIRIAIINKGILEEFDYQASGKKSTKGNIYLAKVTRIEPSLQAAFVDFGGNRHGFLPFAEIHPDYYQIPTSDKDKLLEEIRNAVHGNREASKPSRSKKKEEVKEELDGEAIQEIAEVGSNNADEESLPESQPTSHQAPDDVFERPQVYKRYKIQEVIKKGQVILVQNEKEERGNKGAALTTYISLAGRYCVLMPNATKGGGVSRKIADDQDRDRLKRIAQELTDELEGNGAVIIRTAGAYKTKTEIRKDFSYLTNLWNNIREHTINSNAPTFIHEEGDVIKKTIRDQYDSEVDEILINEDKAFKEAKEFMKLILPKHVNKINYYKDRVSIFAKFGIDDQIAELYSNRVNLDSGGYIIINQTEALVAIDVNSGRATGERNVEGTAVKTNIEAAYEIARQLRLRDLSGLIVIDFIDMEDQRNRRSVEKAVKDALSTDKAKIQIGKISLFGLLEMSRQRLKQSFVEANTTVCEHCLGRGRVRDLENTSVAVLKAIESEIAHPSYDEIQISGSNKLVSFMLNEKRKELVKLDNKHKGKILFYVDETAGGDGFFVERKKAAKDYEHSKEALSRIDDSDLADVSTPSLESKLPKDEEQEREIQPREAQPREAQPRETQPREHHRDRHGRDRDKGGKHNKFKFKKHKSSNRDNNYKDDFAERVNEDNLDNSDERFREKHSKKFRRHENPRHENPRGNTQEHMDIREESQFDEEMAERRKNNQSLLREIWKKFVD